MRLDDAKNAAYDLVLAWKQSRIAHECAGDAPEDLHAKLVEAEHGITHWAIETMLADADRKAGISACILATYGHEWSQIENGADYVRRIHENHEMHVKLAAIWSKLER